MSRFLKVQELHAKILSRVRVGAHAAVKQEAYFQMNARGGRYSDHLAEAVENYLDGSRFGSPLARAMLDEGRT
jgi:hypothetical protein